MQVQIGESAMLVDTVNELFCFWKISRAGYTLTFWFPKKFDSEHDWTKRVNVATKIRNHTADEAVIKLGYESSYVFSKDYGKLIFFELSKIVQ